MRELIEAMIKVNREKGVGKPGSETRVMGHIPPKSQEDFKVVMDYALSMLGKGMTDIEMGAMSVNSSHPKIHVLGKHLPGQQGKDVKKLHTMVNNSYDNIYKEIKALYKIYHKLRNVKFDPKGM